MVHGPFVPENKSSTMGRNSLENECSIIQYNDHLDGTAVDTHWKADVFGLWPASSVHRNRNTPFTINKMVSYHTQMHVSTLVTRNFVSKNLNSVRFRSVI